MPSYYWYECTSCCYRAERYRNVKKCPECSEQLVRLEPEFACYHITTKDRLESILENGLIPNSKPNWFTSETPYIMLSLYPYWWLYQNRQAWGLPEVDEREVVLIEIKSPDIKREYFDDPEGLRWGEIIKPECFNAIIEYQLNVVFEKSRGRGNEVESDIELEAR